MQDTPRWSIARWTGHDDFFQTNLEGRDARLCHLTVEKYPDGTEGEDVWEWQVWPAMELRKGPGLDRHGVSASRQVAQRAARRAALGLEAGLSRLHALLLTPGVASLASARTHLRSGFTLTAGYPTPTATIHALRRIRAGGVAVGSGNGKDMEGPHAA